MRLAILLFLSAFVFGQNNPPTSETKATAPEEKPPSRDSGVGNDARERSLGAVDILSDTQGVDIRPYVERVLADVRQNWYKLIPETSLMKKGKLAIELSIAGDGKVTNMHLAATSGDVSLDRAAWLGVTTSSPFPALPSNYTRPYLVLRLHFYYNPDKSDLVQDPAEAQVLQRPSKSGIAVSISIPGNLQVPLGGSEVVTAWVTGADEQTVEWSVTGSGCSGSGCGKMTGDLYVAPSVMPNPPDVTLTAISKADPTAKASVTVHIVRPASQITPKP